jgi:predicted house-cleaning noncanonical NTP pyrophosphatase (MazG superfamily)
MPTTWRSRVDKLLSSRLPEFVRSAGKSAFERPRRTDARILTLKEQLRQQAVRVAAAETQAEQLEQLADALQLVMALGTAHGISAEQLEAQRRAKHEPNPEQRAPHWASLFRAPPSASGLRALPPLAGQRAQPMAAGFRAPPLASGFPLLRARVVLASAVTRLGGVPRGLLRPLPARARLILRAPQARLGMAAAQPARAVRPLAAAGRYVPVVLVGGGSSAAAWFVATTSRAVLRYVVRPYLVRYLQSQAAGTRLDQGSRALVRLMLPALSP